MIDNHNEKVKLICDTVRDAGGFPYLIGGYVRDKILGIESKDIDIEVFNISIDRLIEVLSKKFNKVNLVGKIFGVIKIDNTIDVSIPRRENKINILEIVLDPNMSFEDAAKRRDFTINSMGIDVDGNLLDPFNGLKDLRDRVLRATSEHFIEDPLRVLRAMQFAGRFEMKLSKETSEMSSKMLDEYKFLSLERIWQEWYKWATKSVKPSLGLKALIDSKWIELYPEIHDMYNCEQDPEWHPEGSVGIHTEHVCDFAAKIAYREGLHDQDRAILMFAALCHDMGKPITFKINEFGRIVNRNHDIEGVSVAERFLKSIGASKSIIQPVLSLVREHMCHTSQLKSKTGPSKRSVRRLAERLSQGKTCIRMWSYLVESDHSGRPPLEAKNPVKKWVKIANELDIENKAPERLVLGRHLIKMGLNPSRIVGEIVNDLYQMQLDSKFSTLEEGLEFAKILIEQKKGNL